MPSFGVNHILIRHDVNWPVGSTFVNLNTWEGGEYLVWQTLMMHYWVNGGGKSSQKQTSVVLLFFILITFNKLHIGIYT